MRTPSRAQRSEGEVVGHEKSVWILEKHGEGKTKAHSSRRNARRRENEAVGGGEPFFLWPMSLFFALASFLLTFDYNAFRLVQCFFLSFFLFYQGWFSSAKMSPTSRPHILFY